MQEKIKKILIVRPDAIGDVLLITPAISLIRQRFPEAQIYVLIKKYTEDAIVHNPDINGIIIDALSNKEKS